MKSKEEIIKEISTLISQNGFTIADTDLTKPWGAFFRLVDSDAERFIDMYFADIKDEFASFDGLSPKYLLVAPSERLSWQYHFNRAEHWRVLDGTVGVKLSDNDSEPEIYNTVSKDGLVQFPPTKASPPYRFR